VPSRQVGGDGVGGVARYRPELAEALSYIPFSSADKYNPLAGQVLTVRYGGVDERHGVSAYTLQIRHDGSPLNLRMTRAVQDALFGPPVLGTPERQRWDVARELRKLELGDTDSRFALTTSDIASGVAG
jgi:hypothetical protein